MASYYLHYIVENVVIGQDSYMLQFDVSYFNAGALIGFYKITASSFTSVPLLKPLSLQNIE